VRRMRSSFIPLAAAMHRPARSIERADRIETVRAPEGWSDVQIEAWLDWADAEGLAVGDSDDPMAEIAHGYARRICPTEAEALAATLLLGLASPARAPACADGVVDLSDPGAARRLREEMALRRV